MTCTGKQTSNETSIYGFSQKHMDMQAENQS